MPYTSSGQWYADRSEQMSVPTDAPAPSSAPAPLSQDIGPTYAEILSGYQKRIQDAQFYGAQGYQDIERRYAGVGSQIQQSLISRGLANTSIAPTMAMGVERDKVGALNSYRDTLVDKALGLEQDKLGYMERAAKMGADRAASMNRAGGGTPPQQSRDISGRVSDTGNRNPYGYLTPPARQGVDTTGQALANYAGTLNRAPAPTDQYTARGYESLYPTSQRNIYAAPETIQAGPGETTYRWNS